MSALRIFCLCLVFLGVTIRVLRVVSLLSATAQYGGPSDTALAQARLVADSGNESVLLAGYVAGDRPDPRESDGVSLQLAQVRRLVPRSRFFMLGSSRFYKLMWLEIRKSDVVHVSVARELLPFVALVMCVLQKRPYIAQPHGTLTTRTSRVHQVLDLAMKPLLRRSKGLICLTHVEEKAISAWCDGLGNITTVGNPVIAEPAVLLGWRNCSSDAVFIGRLHERKRAVDFVGAAEFSQKQGWRESYLLVGPDQGELTSYRHRVEACPNIDYAGEISPNVVPQTLAAARVFVLPSGDEPWGNVLVLALAMGMPVVVTESASLAPLVASFGAGRVVPDQKPEAVARAVHELVTTEEAYEIAAAGASSLSRHHLANSRVQSILVDLYSRTAGQDA